MGVPKQAATAASTGRTWRAAIALSQLVFQQCFRISLVRPETIEKSNNHNVIGFSAARMHRSGKAWSSGDLQQSHALWTRRNPARECSCQYLHKERDGEQVAEDAWGVSARVWFRVLSSADGHEGDSGSLLRYARISTIYTR